MSTTETTLLLLFEAGYLALAAVTGMAAFNLRRDPHNRRGAALVVIAAGMTYYATRRLPPDPVLWLALVPLGLLFVGLGFYAGKGFYRPHRPSMEEQIAELTGEEVNWADVRPDRKPRWRR
jgi:hypothetical protein